jgi:protein ImuB
MSGENALWLGLHFPQLALAVFDDRDPQRPAAVIESRRVHCANRDNLTPGLPLATAQALHPDLLAMERQPLRESELLQNLALLAYDFTPDVALAPDDSLLLEIGSCRRLYRGTKVLLDRLRDAVHERGHVAIFGLAATPKAAWLLAQRPDATHPQQQLDAVPVARLPLAADIVEGLLQMGLETVGQLRTLPRAALGKRFGATLTDYLARLWGECADPQIFFTPPPVFRQGLAFIDGIAQRQMLLFPMKRLLQSLCDYLRARQLRCHRLHWQICDAHHVQAEILVELSRTQNDWQGFLELTRLKLDQVVLREAVFSLHLHSADFFEAEPAATQLFPDARDNADAVHALRDRLAARLGSDALQRVAACDAYWPEHSWRALQLEESVESPAVTNPAPRPLWLLPQPKLLRLRDGQPYLQSALTLLRGPERIGSHWWRDESCERDYYVATTADGRLCWIYCERLSSQEQSQWFLHGWFG